jgi:hypothetical protein
VGREERYLCVAWAIEAFVVVLKVGVGIEVLGVVVEVEIWVVVGALNTRRE